MKRAAFVSLTMLLGVLLAAVMSRQGKSSSNIDSLQTEAQTEIPQALDEQDCVSQGFFYTSFPAKCINLEGELVAPGYPWALEEIFPIE